MKEKKRKLLIATTNQGKIAEMQSFFETLPFALVTLADLKKKIPAPEEGEVSLEENAMRKATYYAKETGLLTLSDDSGLFIDALNGFPGVVSAITAPTAKERTELVLEKMKGVPDDKRTAQMKCVMCLFDPDEGTMYFSSGRAEGVMTKKIAERPTGGFGYDPIFFIKKFGKTYAELSILEKNETSHRGKALKRMEYHLKNTYGAKNIVVPCAFIIKDGKLLMQLRNDPHRPEFHKKWEFPGGGVEFGESMHENIIREVKEEAGYDVEIVQLLQHIEVETQEYPTFKYQVFLVPYVCRITSGAGKHRDEEVLEARWFDLSDVTKQPLVGQNAEMFKTLLPELKQVIQKNNL